MLDHETRTAILRLHEQEHGLRFIARTLGVSRESVKKVIESQQIEVPRMVRVERLDPWQERIRELNEVCGSNLVRVHEELARSGVEVPYSTLTRFCREHKIGYEAPQASGQYFFHPAEEMQHDTSPHRVKVGERLMLLQCASLVMCFSRRRFAQNYPRFNRFYAKVFLTEALRFFGGSATRCMLDNSTVIMTGTGKNAMPVPEMAAFSKHFNFDFVAHEVGDANRSARVEGPFNHIEKNFYPGRVFRDLDDLNAQLRAWCETYNGKFHRNYQGVPDELFAIERQGLRPLPAYIFEPTDVHPRKVDVDGFVCLHTNRYSVDEDYINQDVEVHETLRQVRIFRGHQLIATHERKEDGRYERSILPEHRRRRQRTRSVPPSPEESALRAADPVLAAFCDILRHRDGGQALRSIRRLYQMWTDYPTEAFLSMVHWSIKHTLYDLKRIEPLILAKIHGDFFRLPTES